MIDPTAERGQPEGNSGDGDPGGAVGDQLTLGEAVELIARREGAGQAILDEARKKLGAGNYEIHEELLEGPAAEAILSVAQTREADLIVIGSRGLGSLQGLLFGSVGSKVAHYATCPVMLVR